MDIKEDEICRRDITCEKLYYIVKTILKDVFIKNMNFVNGKNFDVDRIKNTNSQL